MKISELYWKGIENLTKTDTEHRWLWWNWMQLSLLWEGRKWCTDRRLLAICLCFTKSMSFFYAQEEWFYQNAHHSLNMSKGVKVIKRELCPQTRRPYLFQLALAELTPSVQFRPNLATSFDILKSLWLRMSYTLCFAPICSLKSPNRPGINNSLCLFVLSWILQCLYNSMIICINLNRDNCR